MCVEESHSETHESTILEQLSPELAGLFVDSHCHPTDDPAAYASSDLDKLSERIGQATIRRLVCMSTNARDQKMVAELASRHPDKIVPCFWLASVVLTPDLAFQPHAEQGAALSRAL